MKFNFKKIFSLFLILVSVNFTLKAKNYDQDYDQWLKLVHYIITPTEKKIFLSLSSKKDKDAFIKLFWKQRDPTPGTEENEYKNEIIKRFEYANKHFGRGTPKEGWQTDMGRVYIILGPPQRIEEFTNINGLYPIIEWDYYGLNIPGIPKNINLLFFRRNGFGEYELYDPAADGPSSLIQNIETSFSRYEYRKIYKKIRKLAPQLAGPAFSVIPGRQHIMYPQVNNSVILSKILESPEKIVDSTYANNFLKFKGYVKVSTNYNYIKNSLFYSVFKDPFTGLLFFHFSIKPKKLSFSYNSEYEKYYTGITLNIILKKGDKNIFSKEKKFSLSFDKDDFTYKVRPMGIAFDELFPITSGEFNLIVLLQNSTNNEFSYLEKHLTINYKKDIPKIFKPIITYRISKSEQPVIRPFYTGNKILSIDSANIYSLKDKIFLWLSLSEIQDFQGKIDIRVKSRDGYPEYEKNYSFDIGKYRRNEYIIDISKELFPAVYTVSSILYSSKNIPLDTKVISFSVSPLNNVNHPIEIMDGVRLTDKAIFYYKIAAIYANLNNVKKAEYFYDKGLKEKPEFFEEVINYVNFLISIKKLDKAEIISEILKNSKKFTYDFYTLKGKILYLKNRTDEAIEFLEKACSIYDKDYRILNMLGLSYLKKGNRRKAMEFFKKSLEINNNQPIIKKYIKRK